MSTLPIHYALAAVDIDGFGTRSDADQQWLRDRMYELLRDAADGAGICWKRCHRVDRGDSVVLLIPAQVSKVTVAGGFVRELRAGLRTHNRRSREPVAMRLRMALHAGEVSDDGKNWVGTELNTVCRLVDLPQLRQALTGADLALCVSDLWFRTVIQQHPGLVDHLRYVPIVVQVKELDGRAWLRLPDLAEPPGNDLHLAS
ncbi:MAG TPA: hypothetical protein VGX25_19565 [Actinophytocola sp.]|uniref:hypothetical protein n=1 Tax=Actinophytocola sp. TaxID=1872138 RepID=UPI002DDCFD41|nr:hypothetical protein [Actinophytocola sp.]HEV2781587.1 hypothetical protein [Actinophytocola sp.]